MTYDPNDPRWTGITNEMKGVPNMTHPKTAAQLVDCKTDDEILAWLKEREVLIISYQEAVDQVKSALREARIEGATLGIKAGVKAQPCTLNEPDGRDYDRGFFDGVMAYGKALRALSPVSVTNQET